MVFISAICYIFYRTDQKNIVSVFSWRCHVISKITIKSWCLLVVCVLCMYACVCMCACACMRVCVCDTYQVVLVFVPNFQIRLGYSFRYEKSYRVQDSNFCIPSFLQWAYIHSSLTFQLRSAHTKLHAPSNPQARSIWQFQNVIWNLTVGARSVSLLQLPARLQDLPTLSSKPSSRLFSLDSPFHKPRRTIPVTINYVDVKMYLCV